MRRDLILSKLETTPYFTLDGYMQLSGGDNRASARIQLSRWKKGGHVVRLKRGLYMTHHFYQRHVREPGFLPMVSAIILPLSYTSTVFELQHRGILTEVTYPVTAITLKSTRQVTNMIGDFIYQGIRPDLYAGFEAHEYHGVTTYRAACAKALFDYLYLRPIPHNRGAGSPSLAESLRLNLGELSPGDIDLFETYVELSDSPKMQWILESFRETVWRH